MQKKGIPQWIAWHDQDPRTRFKPRNRIGALFLQVVPWLNVAIIILLLYIVADRLVLAPGVVFELPRQPFQEGISQAASIVLLRIEAPSPTTLVFFDDVRYSLTPGDIQGLHDQLAATARRPYGRKLLLLADRRVPHGDVMQVVETARKAGIQKINVGIKPEE